MRIRSIAVAGVLVFWVIALGACGVAGGMQPDSLHGTSWILTYLDETVPLPGVRITVTFEAGYIQGSSGCNHFSGFYKASGNSIVVRNIQSTLMACVEPEGIMDQEQEFLQLLMISDGYQIADGQLQLTRFGQVVLVFIADD